MGTPFGPGREVSPPYPSAEGHASVVYKLLVHVSVVGEPSVMLPAQLRYDRTDPYAVCLSIGAAPTGPVDWVFARSLLYEGLRNPAGIGDVLVIPQRREHGPSVRIVVRSDTGFAILEIAASKVTAFLQQTDRIVPPGREGLHLDVDRVVSELMARRD